MNSDWIFVCSNSAAFFPCRRAGSARVARRFASRFVRHTHTHTHIGARKHPIACDGKRKSQKVSPQRESPKVFEVQDLSHQNILTSELMRNSNMHICSNTPGVKFIFSSTVRQNSFPVHTFEQQSSNLRKFLSFMKVCVGVNDILFEEKGKKRICTGYAHRRTRMETDSESFICI